MTMVKLRIGNGSGPEVTLPEWANGTPTPAQWVDWFSARSREAQEAIADFHLATEEAMTSVCATANDYQAGWRQ